MIVVFFILQSKIIDSSHQAGSLSIPRGITALPFPTARDEPILLICLQTCRFSAKGSIEVALPLALNFATPAHPGRAETRSRELDDVLQCEMLLRNQQAILKPLPSISSAFGGVLFLTSFAGTVPTAMLRNAKLPVYFNNSVT
jgi:hypothetical protein